MKKNYSEKVNKKEIYRLKFTDEEVKLLVESKILRRNGAFYTYRNIESTYQFAKEQSLANNYEFSNKCLKLCLHINPYFHQAASILFARTIQAGEIEQALKYLRNMLLCKKEPFHSTYNTYLYILSTIIPLPGYLKNKAGNLTIDHLKIGHTDILIEEKDQQQYIRKMIYAQKFSYARQLVSQLGESNSNVKKYLYPLHTLLHYAACKQIERKAEIETLVKDNNITGAIEVSEREKSLHHLSLMDSYILLVLKDLQYLSKTGSLPIRDFELVENPNLYDALYMGDYQLAKKMLETFDNMTSYVLEVLINKIIRLQTQDIKYTKK